MTEKHEHLDRVVVVTIHQQQHYQQLRFLDDRAGADAAMEDAVKAMTNADWIAHIEHLDSIYIFKGSSITAVTLEVTTEKNWEVSIAMSKISKVHNVAWEAAVEEAVANPVGIG